MPFGSCFFDHIIHGIFPAEHKVVQWQLHSVAIFLATQPGHYISTWTIHVSAPLGELSSDDKVN